MTGLERSSSMEARGRKPGGMRKLGPMMKLDNVVWLAGGLPHKSAFPMSEVRLEMAGDAEDVVLDDMSVGMGSTAHNGNLYLAQQYLTTPRGYQPLVDWVEAHTKMLHGDLPLHRTIIAGGNTAGTDMVCRILLDKDDSLVVCEEYSYPGFFMVAKNMGVPIVTAAMDKDGMTPAALDAAIEEGLAKYPGRRKVMIYLGTCGQNPTGINYKKERLQALYAVAQERDCTFLEDDPYMYLNCTDGKPSGLYGLACADAGPDDRCSLLSIDTDGRVVRIDTFSKFVAPGMRCSWVTLPEQYLDDAVKAADASTRTGPTFTHALLYEILKKWGDDGLHKQLTKTQLFYRERSEKLDAAAKKYMTSGELATWEIPESGMFMWMKLNVGAEKLVDELVEANVGFGIGNRYMANATPSTPCPYLRISFTFGTDDEFDVGMKTLSSLLKKHAEGPIASPESETAESPEMPAMDPRLSAEAGRRQAGQAMASHFPRKDKDTVWLASGLPNPATFPIQKITVKLIDGTEIVVDDSDAGPDGKGKMYVAQQYGQGKFGYKPMVDFVTAHTEYLHGPMPDHQCVMTAGTTASFDLMARLLMDKEDTVCICEEHSFPGFFNHVKPMDVPVLSVPADEEGIVPEALAEVISEARVKYNPKKIVLYIITCGQNPTGLTYRKKRLDEVMAVVLQSPDVTVLEDDTYMYLNCPPGEGPSGLHGLKCTDAGPEDRCSMLSIDTGARVVRMDTFSKFLSPGLRCAWITAPTPIAEAAGLASQNSTKTGSVMAQIVLAEILAAWGDEGLDAHLKRVQSYYRSRANSLAGACEAHLSGLAEWVIPDSGMFFWMRVKGVSDTGELMSMLMEERIAVVPGKFFEPTTDDDEPSDAAPYFRIAYTVATDEQFADGMSRLARILSDYTKAHGISPESAEAAKTFANRRRRTQSRTAPAMMAGAH